MAMHLPSNAYEVDGVLFYCFGRGDPSREDDETYTAEVDREISQLETASGQLGNRQVLPIGGAGDDWVTLRTGFMGNGHAPLPDGIARLYEGTPEDAETLTVGIVQANTGVDANPEERIHLYRKLSSNIMQLYAIDLLVWSEPQ